jgi:hypothetical protein
MIGPPAPAAAPPAVHLSYFLWSGTSAGAGFTRMLTTSIEVDLSSGRRRRLHQSTSTMMVWNRSPRRPPRGWPELLEDRTPLSIEQVKELADLVEAWLATDPPHVYNRIGGLGREDARVEWLVVQSGDRTHITSINPRREALPGDPHRAPPEWYSLIAAIRTDPSDATPVAE